MKKNKGSSLLEIMIAVAIIGIIVAAFLPSVGNYFSKIIEAKYITEDDFTAQKAIENEIQNIKNQLEANTTPTNKQNYTLFTGTYRRTVSGYPRTYTSSDGNSLFTIVADNRIPEFKVATITSSIIKLWVGVEIPYAYATTPSLSIKSTTVLSDPENVNLTNISRWYVSREGFNINPAETATPLEIEIGTVYPSFPDDYMIIPAAKGTDLTTISAGYAGRFIVYTVTPASTSGKMGKTFTSNPVYISGLPVISGLKLNLDGSKIANNDTTNSVRKSGSSLYVKKWIDVSNNGIYASQTTTNRQPLLIREEFGNFLSQYGSVYSTYAKFLRFDGSNDYMRTQNTGMRATTQFTFFIVRRSSNASLGLGDNQWHVIAGINGISTYQIDNGSTANGILSGITVTSSGSNNSYITIGNVSEDVAELVVYNRILTASETDQVNRYLLDKYKPTID